MEEKEAANEMERMVEHLTQIFAPKWRENSPGFHYKNDESKWPLAEFLLMINGNFRSALLYNLQERNTNGVNNNPKLFSGCITSKPAEKAQIVPSTREGVENLK